MKKLKSSRKSKLLDRTFIHEASTLCFKEDIFPLKKTNSPATLLINTAGRANLETGSAIHKGVDLASFISRLLQDSAGIPSGAHSAATSDSGLTGCARTSGGHHYAN